MGRYWTIEKSRWLWNEMQDKTSLFYCHRPTAKDKLCKNLVKTNQGCYLHRAK